MLKRRIKEIRERSNELCDMEDIVLDFVEQVEKELDIYSNNLAKAYRDEIDFLLENVDFISDEGYNNFTEEDTDIVVDNLMNNDYLSGEIIEEVRDEMRKYLDNKEKETNNN